MAVATLEPIGYDPRGSRRDRALAWIAAIGVTLLLLLMLVRLGVLPPIGRVGTPSLVTMSFPGQGPERARVVRQAKRAAGGHAATRAPRPTPHVQVAPPSPVPSLNIIHVGHDELAALDLAMATSHGGHGAGRASGDAKGDDDGGGDQGGGGQAGDRLYDADWYRRPTDAETNTYFAQVRARTGWGMIACRTAPRFRVEDCKELDETPGSGIARALREAAWQFQVLPPRINGRPQIGAWVRIRFDLIEGFKG